MPRRRYRLFTVVAAVVLFMLYHVAQNSWDQQPPRPVTVLRDPPSDKAAGGGFKPDQKPNIAGNAIEKKRPVQHDEQQPLAEKPKAIKDQPKEKPKAIKDQPKENPVTKETTDKKVDKTATEKNSQDDKADPKIKLPKLNDHDTDAKAAEEPVTGSQPSKDKTPSKAGSDTESSAKEKTPVALNKPPSGTHWRKFPEHFPVPSGSVRPLPTGKPANIPKIQHEFGKETEAAKAVRLERLSKIKSELKQAWKGYRENAFMHDELRPVDGSYRDPFCGWAATLVDSLDTLWIAGMKDEFEDALTGVAQIDFTTSEKDSIPVFETTIRYLGGLLAAYDVSEHKYKILLEKAVELGEILFGIFDTPNRMPVLYYHWKPSSAKNPHYAGQVGMAELATLSMEFTRLAQLTHDNKYYDAIDRITDELIDLGKRGTAIPGLFPETLDAGGCNKSATATRVAREAKEKIKSKKSQDNGLVDVPTLNVGKVAEDKRPRRPNAVIAANGRIQNRAAIPEDYGFETPLQSTSKKTDGSNAAKAKSDLAAMNQASTNTAAGSNAKQSASDKTVKTPPQIPQGGVPHREPMTPALPEPANDCVRQGLVPWNPDSQRFHMGGAQDSAYEYFPKEYLLLGGLEEKYKKLHVDTIKAIDEYLMYRPMIQDEDNKWDILFPAVMVTDGDNDTNMQATYEITHLTCFVGGMYGMGGKIFGRPQDVETAKKLTDGCVWAYSVTASGIMPENAQVVPCPSLEKCEFNQTMWYDELDHSKEDRERRVAEWDKKWGPVAARKAKADQVKSQAASEPTAKPQAASGPKTKSQATSQPKDNLPANKAAVNEIPLNRVGKRAAIPPPDEEDDKVTQTAPATKTAPKDGAAAKDDKAAEEMPPTKTAPKAEAAPEPEEEVYIPPRPQTHQEYVEANIRNNQLPPGFSAIGSRHYILRPEAIESVWYMYRITGDAEWMEKGWKMFEATIKATKTRLAHSAIRDVMMAKPQQQNEMESFWIAETLKYYYLLFSQPDVISLDEWVFNTEAHPMRRPTA